MNDLFPAIATFDHVVTHTAVEQIVAHRGPCADRPENTLAGIPRAIEATAVEPDVRATKESA